MMHIKKMLICGMVVAMVATGSGITAFAAESSAKDDEIARIISQKLDNIKVVRSADSSTTGSPSLPAGTKSNLTKDELKVYADKVFELVNKEREKAGLTQVKWDDELAACAQIRAEELQYLYSHTRPVQPKDTTKVWPENTNGKGAYNAPSVADEQGVAHAWIMENAAVQYETSEAVMDSWMNSTGHKNNILRESHVRCGVGVYYTKDETPTGFHWFWVIWLDSYET